MRHTTPRLTAAGLVLALTLAGCGTPPWATSESTPATGASSSGPAASSSATSSSDTPSFDDPATAATPEPSTTTAPGRNDLSTGSAKRTLEAGAIELKVTYYSTLDLGSWTPAAKKPLNLSASAKFIDGSKQDIFLGQVTVAIETQGPTGALDSPKDLIDEAKVSPGFAVRSPVAYGQIFMISAVDEAATSVTLTITYELLGQTGTGREDLCQADGFRHPGHLPGVLEPLGTQNPWAQNGEGAGGGARRHRPHRPLTRITGEGDPFRSPDAGQQFPRITAPRRLRTLCMWLCSPDVRSELHDNDIEGSTSTPGGDRLRS